MTTPYDSLGVEPIINAIGTFTRLGGSLMPPEVVEAMGKAARQFVLDRFASETIAARWLDAYQAVLGGAGVNRT